MANGTCEKPAGASGREFPLYRRFQEGMSSFNHVSEDTVGEGEAGTK